MVGGARQLHALGGGDGGPGATPWPAPAAASTSTWPRTGPTWRTAARATARSLLDRLHRHGLLARARCSRTACTWRRRRWRGRHARGAWIAHNPRSNMNNAVGYAPTAALQRAALGTDGMDEDMLAEARAAFLQDARRRPRRRVRAPRWSCSRAAIAWPPRCFGLPFGKLDSRRARRPRRPRLRARPRPLAHRQPGRPPAVRHATAATCASVMVAGRWVVRDRRVIARGRGRRPSPARGRGRARPVAADGPLDTTRSRPHFTQELPCHASSAAA